MSDEQQLKGRVMRSHGSRYFVNTAEGTYACKLRGKFRLSEDRVTNPVAVGDDVMISIWRDEGTIEEVLPRRNKLARLAPGNRNTELEHILVANIDQVLFIASAKKPRLKLPLIDRFLVATEYQHLNAMLCINKMDLIDPPKIDEVVGLYRALDYPVYLTSAKEKTGIEPLREVLSGKLSVLTGHSGVGKSSLLNVVEPGLGIRVGKVSQKTHKGRHTTVHSELLSLSTGGFVADTPGFREFGLMTIEPEELAALFPEFRDYLGECQFHNCQHLAEPNCAVKDALATGDVAQSRYESYQKLHEEMSAKPKY